MIKSEFTFEPRITILSLKDKENDENDKYSCLRFCNVLNSFTILFIVFKGLMCCMLCSKFILFLLHGVKSGNDIFHMSIVAQPRIANSNTKRKVKVTLSSLGCQLKTRISCSKQFQIVIFWTRQSFYLISNFSWHT